MSRLKNLKKLYGKSKKALGRSRKSAKMTKSTRRIVDRARKTAQKEISRRRKRDIWPSFKRTMQAKMPLREADEFYKATRKGSLIVKKALNPRNWQLGGVQFVNKNSLRGMSDSYYRARKKYPNRLGPKQIGRAYRRKKK